MGRPSIYTEELAREVCQRTADGESLRSIALDNKMPNRSTLHEWLLDKTKTINGISFSDHYETAVNIRTENMFHEIVDIPDRVDPTETNKARLQVDARKWYLSKVMPKKYGDKIDVTSGNKPIPLLNAIFNNNSNEEGSESQEED